MIDNFIKSLELLLNQCWRKCWRQKRKWTKDKRQEDAYDLRQRLQND